jgi:O-antigen/teichoic acid export membrane protein
VRNLIKGVLKTGSGVAANLLIGMATIKVMALILGPAGTGLYSLIRQSAFTFASLGAGGQTALVQGVASKVGVKRDSYVRSVFWLFVLAALISLVLIQTFAPAMAELVFGKNNSENVQLMRWIALPVILMHAYIFLKGVLNGYRAIGRLALIEMIGPLITLMLVYPVCVLVGEGYALAFVWILSAAQLMMISMSLLTLRKQGWLPALIVNPRILIERTDLRYFVTISGTTFLTGVIGTATILSVRAMIAGTNGLTQAGMFDLAWSLSGSYVALILASFGTYYAPTLSQAIDNTERAMLIRRVIRLSTLLMIPLIVTVVVLKPMVVGLLYSREYMPSLEIVKWMLIGDYLKITCWVLAIPVIVNSDMKIYFWTETFWYLSFLSLAAYSTVYLGELQGIGIAFVVPYLALVIYYLQYVRRVYVLKISRDLLLPWLVGLLVVIMASMQNWNSTAIDRLSASAWIIGSIALVAMFLKKSERDAISNWIYIKFRMSNEA